MVVINDFMANKSERNVRIKKKGKYAFLIYSVQASFGFRKVLVVIWKKIYLLIVSYKCDVKIHAITIARIIHCELPKKNCRPSGSINQLIYLILDSVVALYVSFWCHNTNPF